MANQNAVGVYQKENGYWEYRFVVVVDGILTDNNYSIENTKIPKRVIKTLLGTVRQIGICHSTT